VPQNKKILYFNQFHPVVIVYSKWMNWTEVQNDKTTIKYYKGKFLNFRYTVSSGAEVDL